MSNGISLSGSNLKINYRPEQVWGVVDTTIESKSLYVVSESLTSTSEKIDSATIGVGGRGVPYSAKGLETTGGGLEFELNKNLLGFLSLALGEVTTTQPDTEVEEYEHVIKVTKPKPFTVEKTLDEQKYYLFKGCYLDNFSVAHEPGAAVKVTANVISREFSYSDDSINVTTLPAQNFSFVDTIRFNPMLDNTPVDYNSLTWSITNNMETSTGLGKSKLSGAAPGIFIVEGSLSVNVPENDTSYLDKIYNNETNELKLFYGEGADAFTVKILKMKVFGDAVPKGSTAGLISLDISFTGELDATAGTPLLIEATTTTPTL